ncbi:MAG: hypothetical protein PF447_06710 [Spirochaetaceae bacterium]|jgi:PAS domain-containing protein|nr:hypothetical protein [Spirochaetaceae bacterium]
MINREDILQKSPFGYALHQIILDDQENPVDYVFLDINDSFEGLTGLKRQNLIGKRVTKVMQKILQECS